MAEKKLDVDASLKLKDVEQPANKDKIDATGLGVDQSIKALIGLGDPFCFENELFSNGPSPFISHVPCFTGSCIVKYEINHFDKNRVLGCRRIGVKELENIVADLSFSELTRASLNDIELLSLECIGMGSSNLNPKALDR
ncbi:hypothetical protein Ancab_029815 [Ancistrocladus abbreviatus]